MVELAAWVAAGSSAVLAVFAGYQMRREHLRGLRLTKAAETELTGPAWLALRTLETTIREAKSSASAIPWAGRIGLDALQEQMLDVLRIAGGIDSARAASARSAFAHFLAYADAVNALAILPMLGQGRMGEIIPTKTDEAAGQALAQTAFDELRAAVEILRTVVPRSQVPTLPADDELPMLGPGDGTSGDQ